jgi:hypothetical protein
MNEKRASALFFFQDKCGETGGQGGLPLLNVVMGIPHNWH